MSDPSYGYYMTSTIFGRSGDFVTSPEISQLFGEAVGTWCASVWEYWSKPRTWNIIELGPGKGTLAMDVIRTLKQLRAVDGLKVHLVDTSPSL